MEDRLTTSAVHARPGRRLPHRLAALALPILLVLVAGVQRYRAYAGDESSWSGVGFGMFSTVNQERLGFLRADAVSPSGTTVVGVPDPLAREVLELKADPRQAKLDEVARKWLVALRANDPLITELRVSLWHVSFSNAGPTLRAYQLLETVVR
ncbi:MAG: hypothetical protein QOE63_1613 [Acidimicrobiaceae bacterium]